MMEKLELTQEWDKVFPKSDKVHHEKVTFPNRYPSCRSDLSLYESYSQRKIWNFQINDTSCFYLDN